LTPLLPPPPPKFSIKGFAATLNDSQLAKVVLLQEVEYFEGDGQVTGYAKSHHKFGANRVPKKIQTKATAVLAPAGEDLNKVKVVLTGVPSGKGESNTATKCRLEEQVNCFASPCQMAKCEKHPEAECRENYCGGCNAEFFVKGAKVSCDASSSAGSGSVVTFSNMLPYVNDEQWVKTFPPQGSFTVNASRLEEVISFLQKYGYNVEVKKPLRQEL
jgi:hypothetical protein